MVAFIEKKGTVYIQDDDGDTALVGVRTSPNGDKYLQAYVDGVWNDRLLSLPDF